MQSKRTKKLIVINSVLLAVLVIGFAYAWFAVNYNSTVDTDEVEVIADNALELSLDGTNWTSSYLNLNSNGMLDNLEFRDITGDGSGTFLRPTLVQDSGFAMPGSTWSDPQATPGTPAVKADYIKFNLYMRSADKLDVYLGSNSSVAPLTDSTKLIGADAGNKSPYGDFSKDLAAGAVRISAAADTGHLFTWIPCPNIFLETKYDSPITNYEIDLNASSASDYTDNYSPYEHYYNSSSGTHDLMTLSADKLLTTLSDTTGDTLPAKQKLASLTTKDSNGYYKNKVTVYIWLEGCDNEARRAFAGGKFSVSIVLDAVDTVSGS